MVRVGFLLNYRFEEWVAGFNYFFNLVDAVLCQEDRKVEPVILAGWLVEEGVLSNLGRAEVVRFTQEDLAPPAGLLYRLAPGLRTSGVGRVLRRHGVALLSHVTFPSAAAGAPMIGWIPDFQHKRMPGFFGAAEVAARDAQFRELCDRAVCVVVSSRDAEEDMRRFFPEFSAKARVLNFVAGLRGLEESDAGEVERRYGVRRPYLYAPNQFWAHKNHTAVVEALRVLKGRGRRVTVVATGGKEDYRNPGYFDSLMEKAERYGIREDFITPGLVPRGDVLALMRHSAALVNPSLFEGWSTSVEEGKSMGKRIILSDIPVHREQAPPGGIYFDPENPEALADAMARVMDGACEGADAALEERARVELPSRRRAFAKRYEEIALEAAQAV